MKKVKILWLTVWVLFTNMAWTQGLPNYLPKDSLLGWWPLKGNAMDMSGRGNHGMVSGAELTIDRNGNPNGAYKFSPNVNSKINMVLPQIIKNNFTMTMWVKPLREITYKQNSVACFPNVTVPLANSNQNWAILPQHGASPDVGVGFSIGKNAIIVGEHAGNILVGKMSLEANFDRYVHVAIIYRKDSTFLYLDGKVSTARETSCTSASKTIPIDFIIGASLYSPNFHGEIDDVGMWNRALTSAEVQQLYTAEIKQPCLPDYVPTNGLVGYWPFCGDASDESGNGLNGTVNGATLISDRFGNQNSAYLFDNDQESIVTPPTVPGTISEKMTLSMWVNSSDSNSIQSFYLRQGNNFSRTQILYLAYEKAIRIYNESSFYTYFITTQTWTNNWNHLIVSFEGNRVIVYVNGKLELDGQIPQYPFTWTNDFQQFGNSKNVGSAVYPFKGKLDDIGIWNRALTEEEIQKLYLGDSKEVTIQCDKAILHGTLQQGVSADGMKVSIPYTNGDGSQYAELSLNSEGVSGLTATLQAGNFANGNGLLTFVLSGTPEAEGKARFNLNLAGQNCAFTLDVMKSAYNDGSVFCSGKPTAVIDVTNPKTGRIWMDRNLGASNVATSLSDANAFGDMYQWGRRADGHQCRNSDTINVASNTDQPDHDDFIIKKILNFNWLSTNNIDLWQGINGVNNPCPVGYRLPTDTELEIERLSWNGNNRDSAFASPLRLPITGSRSGLDGIIFYADTYGVYWSSTATSNNNTQYLFFDKSNANVAPAYRSAGQAIRCIKENNAIIGSFDCDKSGVSGEIMHGIHPTGITLSIPYSGGNGAYYPEQIFTSTGVSGLSAKLSNGFLTNGSDILYLEISGTPNSSGIASFDIFIAGANCKISVNVLPNPSLALTLILDTLTLNRGEEGLVRVRTKNFNDVLSAQFTLDFDPSVVQLNGVEAFGTDSLTAASFNLAQAASGKVMMVWTQNDGKPVTLPDSSTLFALRFTAIGRNTQVSPVAFGDSPTAIEFVGASLEPLTAVQLNNGAIRVYSEASLSGRLLTETGDAIRTATLTVSGGESRSLVTGTAGTYSFVLPENIAYTLTPSKGNDTLVTNGISIGDVLRIHRHVLNVTPLPTPYKIIAADVNRSGTVSSTDINLINALILGRIATFPGGQLWSFVPTDYVFPRPDNPFPFPGVRTLTSFGGANNQDFTGMKLGDVDNSYNPAQARPRSTGIEIYIEDADVVAGSTISVPVRVRRFSDVAGFQCGITWDPTVLSITGITEATGLPTLEAGTEQTDQGRLTLLWMHPGAQTSGLPEDAAFVTLHFRVTGAPGSATEVMVNDAPSAPVQFILGDLSEAGVSLRSGTIRVASSSSVSDGQRAGFDAVVSPNPYLDNMKITVYSHVATEARLEIFDVTGKLIVQRPLSVPAGTSQCTLSDELEQGIYIVRLSSSDGRLGKTLRVIRQ